MSPAAGRVARRSVALGAALLALAQPAAACGLEDPASIGTRRGALNMAYPESLHVGTAVWQAQLAGRLPRDPLARRADLLPEDRARRRLARADALLDRLVARLSGAPDRAERPGVAIVLLGPVLWSRLEAGPGPVQAHTHVAGPEPDDVVAVTDTPVIEAITRGKLDFARAMESGVLRLYGSPAGVSAARDWLAAATGH